MVEHVSRSARHGQSIHPAARGRRAVRLNLGTVYSRAIERKRVAVAAIGIGSVLAQPWQRSRQFSASLL
jgi:hypothetical protein